MEIDDGSDVTPDNLYRELHPIKNVAKKKFSKPRPPQNRAPRTQNHSARTVNNAEQSGTDQG